MLTKGNLCFMLENVKTVINGDLRPYNGSNLQMRGLGPDVMYLVGPQGVSLLGFFRLSIHLYLLLSPY